MTLPQDVAALLAAAGVADATYQDFSNERSDQERDASPWRLLRNVAMPGDASVAFGPNSSGLADAGIEEAKRSTARDDAFVAPSFAPRAKRSPVNEDSRAHAAPFMQPLQVLAQDAGEPLGGDQTRRPAVDDRHDSRCR